MNPKKILLPLLALSVVAHAQKATKPKPGFEIKYEKFVLPNGLEVVLHEDHSDPIVAVATVMHVGSSREKEGRTGFAHLFEHMSFNHSENTPRGASRKLVPEWGGDRNGFTNHDRTVFYDVVPKDALDKILWLSSDRLGFMINTVTKEALAKEVQVVKNEKRQNYDNVPYGSTNEVLLANLYPKDHPHNWTVIGSLPDLQSASLEDVKEFYDKYYGAANATLVIAGDIDPKTLKEKIMYWYGEIRRGPDVQPMKPKPVQLTESKSLMFEDNFARLPELNMVFPTVEQYHKDLAALDALTSLLSSGRTSPLYKVIVEQKKLAPNVSAGQRETEMTGDFRITVRGNADTDLDQVKSAVAEALALFEKEGFSDADLNRIKTKAETSLYGGVETILNKALQLGMDNEFAGDPGHITKAAAAIQKLTKEDIWRVYNQYIKGKHYVMTSFVPKGKKDLAVAHANEAKIWMEQVVANVQEENVDQGAEAVFAKTVTKNNRKEPPFTQMPLFKMPQVATGTLKNGIKLYHLESRETPLVHFDIVIPGGHWADPIDKAGLSLIVAEMLKQGTATKTPAQLEEAIEQLGASISVSSGNEEMRIRATCLDKSFEQTLALVQEMLLQPRWDKAEFDRITKAVTTGLKGREANANAINALVFNKLVYGNDHILGTPVNGTLQTINNITLDDVKQYYNAYLTPKGARMHVVGSVDKNRITQAVASLEQKWNKPAATLPSYALPKQDKGGKLYFVDFPGAKQSVIQAGKLALSAADEASNNLDFANEVLGVGSSGRLTQVLRIGKGYTYGAGSGIMKMKEVSPFFASTSVRANATLPSLEIIRNMLVDYGPKFTENEVEITKNKIIKRSSLQYESGFAKLAMLNDMSKYNKPVKYIEEDQQELIKMTLEDFKKVIARYLAEDEMIYIVVGDKATQFEEVKKLGKPVVELDYNGNPLKGF